VLGRKRTPKAPSFEDGPSTLADAWRELRPIEFALWCRLCASDAPGLAEGRKTLAEKLGYSYRQLNQILRELDRKGFVSLVRNGSVTQITIVRKAIVTTSCANFLRLSI
jgi:predicted transcriptional regulator